MDLEIWRNASHGGRSRFVEAVDAATNRAPHGQSLKRVESRVRTFERPFGSDIAFMLRNPVAATRLAVEKVYDNLDFQRGVQVFLTGMTAGSASAMRKGIRSLV